MPLCQPRLAAPRLRTGGNADVEESGWKMVSGDVFRAPSSPMSLCIQVGSGVQLLFASFITLFFAALGAWRMVVGVIGAGSRGLAESARVWLPACVAVSIALL